MKKRLLILAGAFALVALMTAQTFATEVTIRGSLGRTVEAGGWLIHTKGEKYLLLNPQRFRNETWFRESAEVEATGEVRRGAVTIYQEGVPFEARTMRPLAGDSADAGRLSHVHVTGDALVRAQPDTAVLSVSVVTQGKSALDAQRENAARSEAVSKAEAVARALGGRLLRVVEVNEDGATPRPVYQARAAEFATARVASGTPTPIEVGTLDIRSQVRLVAEFETGR